MLIAIIATGICLMLLERLFPDQTLPVVRNWWSRVVIVNAFQLGVILLAMFTWDRWFLDWQAFKFDTWPAPIAGFLSYFLVTFVFYWWHRWRHNIPILWLIFHQVHHSPQRIETITSFYKHPLEIICNSLIIGTLNYLILGISFEAASWSMLYASLGEYFYHMNI